jgi:hypothetical protein
MVQSVSSSSRPVQLGLPDAVTALNRIGSMRPEANPAYTPGRLTGPPFGARCQWRKRSFVMGEEIKETFSDAA